MHTNPLNKSNLARASTYRSNHSTNSSRSIEQDDDGDMVATKTAEDAKRKKYARLTRENSARFITAAMETTGGMGKELRDFLDDVSLIAQEERNGWEAMEVASGIRCAAAIAIQVGNARIITESRHRIAKRALEWDRHEARVRHVVLGGVSAA